MASKQERETIIHFAPLDDYVSIYSTERGIWRRCEKARAELQSEDGGGREYRMPARCFGFRLKRLCKTTPEGRERQLRALAKARAARARNLSDRQCPGPARKGEG